MNEFVLVFQLICVLFISLLFVKHFLFICDINAVYVLYSNRAREKMGLWVVFNCSVVCSQKEMFSLLEQAAWRCGQE